MNPADRHAGPVAIVDYGMGNVRSLRNALEYIGAEVVITADDAELDRAARIVLPGVGAFGDAMQAIRERGLDRALTHQALERHKPVLGICLGMQLFARSSNEHGEHAGLGWIDADVRRLQVERPLTVPHVGWNNVEFDAGEGLFAGIRPPESNFYFVHSYHMVCHEPGDCVATTRHGSAVTAAVRRGNLVATQFHPEKSQDNGLRLLANWLAATP
ncbi:MAG: imidazole glycerol phosphate synthase subunit HisH [Rubrivivax sp.]|nr:imidazole glycerol phosphate synthase subunit HisH [Rubrivivax sp.]